MGNTPTKEEKKDTDPLHIALKNKEPKNIILELAKEADLRKRDLNGNTYRYNALKNLYTTEVLKCIVEKNVAKNHFTIDRDSLTYDTQLFDALRNKMSDEIVISLINDDSKCASTKFEIKGNDRYNFSDQYQYSITVIFDLSYEASTHFLAKEMGYSEEILSLLETTHEERRKCYLNENIDTC